MKVIACGWEHTLLVDRNFTAFAFGKGHWNQLGLGVELATPTQIPNIPSIVWVFATETVSLFVDVDGCIWGCGLGVTNNDAPGKLFSNLPKIMSVSAGTHHLLMLDEEGSVWARGNNRYGQLGVNHERFPNVTDPVKLVLPKIQSIHAGHKRSLFLDETGSVWGCGKNKYGELGTNALATHNLGQLGNLPAIQDISLAKSFVIFLDADGKLWGSGLNKHGELGLGHSHPVPEPEQLEKIPAMQAVSVSLYHSLFLDIRGRAWGCGLNGFGQLGPSLKLLSLPHTSPIKISGLPKLHSIYAGTNYSMFVDLEGKVWACGNNSYGQLGIPIRKISMRVSRRKLNSLSH